MDSPRSQQDHDGGGLAIIQSVNASTKILGGDMTQENKTVAVYRPPLRRRMSSHWETASAHVGGRTMLVRKPSVLPGMKAFKKMPKLSDDDEEEPDAEVRSSSSSETALANLIPQTANLNEKVIINVGGQIHETYLATLNRLPDTRLAKVAQDYEHDPAYDPETGTFFFNRNPIIFVSILQYYRTGELHIDHNVCGNAIKNELDFWQIDPNDIEPCCWAQYAKFLENKETLKMLDDSFAIYEDVFAEPENEIGWRRLQRRLWRHIEDPSYSVVGKVFASLSIFFVIISIVSYVLETHTFFRVPRFYPPQDINVTDVENMLINGTLENVTHFDILQLNYTGPDDNPDFFEMTENNSTVVWWLSCIAFVCFGWFALEYVARLILCPNKREFFKSMLNNLDLLVLLAMCFESLAIILVDIIPRNRYIRVLIPLRFARIIRIMKLMKHYRAFKVLVYTIKVSAKELALMIIFLMIGVVIFACLVYYVEPETFDNIPIGCWWALVTMTTVGYGDYHPYKVGGYIIGCIAAIFGVLMIAFTVPIVVNNFSLYYSHAQTRAKMRPKRRATKLLNKLAALTMFVPTLEEIKEATETEKMAHVAKKLKVANSAMVLEEELKTEGGLSSSSTVDSGMDDKKKKKTKGWRLRSNSNAKKSSSKHSVPADNNHKHHSHRDSPVDAAKNRSKPVREGELDEVTVLPTMTALNLQPSGKNSDEEEHAVRHRTHSFGRSQQAVGPNKVKPEKTRPHLPSLRRGSIANFGNFISRQRSNTNTSNNSANSSNFLSPPPIIVVEPSRRAQPMTSNSIDESNN